MNRAKFPGTSGKKLNRPQVSFHDLDQTTSQMPSEFREAKAQLMAELPALREQFPDDTLEFRGFSPNDELHSVCNQKRTQLNSMVLELAKQNLDDEDMMLKRPNDSFKTPQKVEIIQSSGQLEEKKTPQVLIHKDDKKIESVAEKVQSDTAVKAASSIDTAQSISNNTISPMISNDFFLEKEEYVASVIILTDRKLNQNYDLLKQEIGLVYCGVCLSIDEYDDLELQREHGAFLCSKCIHFLQKMIEIANRADAFFTCGGQGACEISSETEYCEACFVQSCLLLLDLDVEIFFKMWSSVPVNAKNFVPFKPPVYKRYPNRGKVLYVDMVDGTILKICEFLPENSNEASTSQTNGQVKIKGVKCLFPNDEATFPRGARVKQVSRRVDNPLPIATFADAMEILGMKSVQEEENKKVIVEEEENKEAWA